MSARPASSRAFRARTDARILAGACENLATPSPLGPFVDVADQAGGGLADALAGADARNAARAVLAELDRSTVIVLEDVHWADEATLDALRVIGRRIEGVGGAAIATYRDDEASGEHPLRVVLGELASAPGVARSRCPGFRSRPCAHSPRRPARTATRSTGSRSATPSSRPRSWRRRWRSFRRRCATRCSRVSRSSAPRPGGCWTSPR
ncbi:MAG TPA: hypothetical protein VFI83_11365 [Gaiella sp.]|nr:hypothetical protein [Gaiella sp.]